MAAHPQVKHIVLTRHGSLQLYEKYPVEGLQKIRQKAKYRISTQASIWRVEILKSYLRPEENGWIFEIYGTWRPQRKQECFLPASFESERVGPVIDYLHTGIIKCKWLEDMPTIFARNGIEIDYSKRGFYNPKPPLLHKLEVAKKLFERPDYLMRQLFLS